MPVRNAVGDVIHDRCINTRLTEFYAYLAAIKWPNDKALIKRMPYDIFRLWFYGLQPLDALLMSNQDEFIVVRNRVQTKNDWQIFTDWVWRRLHGIHF